MAEKTFDIGNGVAGGVRGAGHELLVVVTVEGECASGNLNVKPIKSFAEKKAALLGNRLALGRHDEIGHVGCPPKLAAPISPFRQASELRFGRLHPRLVP